MIYSTIFKAVTVIIYGLKSNYQPTSHDKFSERDRNRETEDALEWLYLGGMAALQKMKQSLSLFFCLLMMALGECLLACEKKVESRDRVSEMKILSRDDFVVWNMMDIL